jgi:hypothetical protein
MFLAMCWKGAEKMSREENDGHKDESDVDDQVERLRYFDFEGLRSQMMLLRRLFE